MTECKTDMNITDKLNSNSLTEHKTNINIITYKKTQS